MASRKRSPLFVTSSELLAASQPFILFPNFLHVLSMNLTRFIGVDRITKQGNITTHTIPVRMWPHCWENELGAQLTGTSDLEILERVDVEAMVLRNSESAELKLTGSNDELSSRTDPSWLINDLCCSMGQSSCWDDQLCARSNSTHTQDKDGNALTRTRVSRSTYAMISVLRIHSYEWLNWSITGLVTSPVLW